MKKKIGKIVLFLILFISINLIFSSFQDTKAATTIYVPLNGSYTLTETSNQYSIGDSSIASVSVGSPYTYTCANLGSDSTYNGAEVDLNDCLYKFTASGSKYTVQGNGVYVNPGRVSSGGVYTYYANADGSAKLTISNSNGDFTFTKSNYYLNYNTNKYITCVTSSSGRSSFSLYRKVTNGETSSTEIPGFIKVTSITSGQSYLIVKKDGNDYYILYPTSSRASNYSQTAKINNITGVDYTITGNSVGTTTLTINGNQYNIRVFDENEILEPDSNFVDKSLTIGMGTTYKIKTNTSGMTWTSNNPAIATVSSDGTITPVAVGETTVIANLNGIKYEIRVRVINSSSSGVLVNMLVDCDEDTIPYYNHNFSNTSIELQDGERLYLYESSSNFNAINFYGKPKTGKVLSVVTVASGYTALTSSTASEVQNETSTSYLNNQATQLSTSTVANGVTNAIGQGVEGISGYSRNSGVTTSCADVVSFRSEDLSADVVQSVYSINGTTYQTGDQARAGDTVIFKVVVSKSSSDELLVTYDGTLTNSLAGAVFIGTSPQGNGNATTQSVTLSSLSATSETYYVKYVVPNGTSGTITNVVDFDYSTYTNDVLKTASYQIHRPNITSSATVGAGSNQVTTITLTKNISGNMREPDKYFKFLVTINGTNGDQYTISGQDAQISYNGVTINTSSIYTVGNTNYVYLKGGQTITIGLAGDGITKEIPLNITYSITEQDASEYSTTITGIQGTTKTTGNLTTGATNDIEFTNSRDRAALTGQFFGENIFTVVLLISGLIFLIKVLKDIIEKNKTKFE